MATPPVTPAATLTAQLQAAGITYDQVRRRLRPPVSWQMVYLVVKGKKTSARIRSVIDRLLREAATNGGKAKRAGRRRRAAGGRAADRDGDW